MANKDESSSSPTTMSVTLEDGSTAQRPFAMRRASSLVVGEDPRVPMTYPGEEAVPMKGGEGWLIRRVPK